MVWKSVKAPKDLYGVLLEAQSEVGQGFFVHEHGRALYGNEACSRIAGYGWEELKALPSVLDLVVPEERDVLVGRMRRRLRGCGVVERYETAIVHKAGRRVEVEIAVKPLRGERPGQLLVLIRDITERKRAEERLREAEARYRTLVEQIPAFTFVVDLDNPGVLAYVSPQIETILGYSSEQPFDFEGWLETVHPDDRERLMVGFDRSLQTGEPFRWEFRQIAKDGRVVWVREEAAFVRDEAGRLRFLQGVVSDVTERKEAEEALKRSEERFRSMIQNASDVITILEADGMVRYESPSIERVSGYKPEELVGRNIFDCVHPEDRERVRRFFTEGLENTGAAVEKTTGAEVGYRFRHADGSWRHLESVCSNLLEDPNVEGIVVNSRDVTGRKRMEEELRKSERGLAAAQRIARVGSWEYDAEREEVRWSDEHYRILGLSPERFVPTPETFSSYVHPEDRELIDRWRRDPSRNERRTGIEFRVVRPDGEARVVQMHREAERDEAGKPRRVGGTIQDVTERRRAEEALRESEERFRATFEGAAIGMALVDLEEGRLAASNPALQGMLGYGKEELSGMRSSDLAHPDDAAEDRAEELLAGERDSYQAEKRYVRKDGSLLWGHLAVSLVRGADGEPRFLVLMVEDVTERKALEERLIHQALHDPLTGLANRDLFGNRLGHALARTKRRESKVAVLFMDLDNFKFVNDSLGHEAGDKLLKGVAGHLRVCLRPEDTVARLGGDEFAVLLEDVGDVGEATRVAERIAEEMRAPFVVEGQEMFVTPSIGIAFGGGGTDQDRPEALLREADVAMYRAKEEGKARHRVFEEAMEARVKERLKTENDLRRALERDEFEVHYQPVVGLKTGRIVGVEALVRWRHPERGLVLPDEFVPLAEEIGLIVPIGRRVLREACWQAREWQEGYPDFSDPLFTLGVNVSARQLRDPGLVGDVEEVLDETGLDPRQLTLEITESSVVGDEEHQIDALRRLGDLGVRFALDDFGTGYSSLSYIRRLPVGLLKIDGSFVERIGEDPRDEILLSGVVGIASGLGLYVLAEGVETPEQLARVKHLGCDLAQGNYFSGPLPAGAAAELLAARDRWC